jgi:hypothetical protein
LTYIRSGNIRPISVAETQVFARAAERIWDEDERNELIDHLARNPEAGDVIPGTGGVRKLRWSRKGSGKRGGARVIYFYYQPDRPIYLLLVYAKAQASDLTSEEKKAVSAFAMSINAGDRRPG